MALVSLWRVSWILLVGLGACGDESPPFSLAEAQQAWSSLDAVTDAQEASYSEDRTQIFSCPDGGSLSITSSSELGFIRIVGGGNEWTIEGEPFVADLVFDSCTQDGVMVKGEMRVAYDLEGERQVATERPILSVHNTGQVELSGTIEGVCEIDWTLVSGDEVELSGHFCDYPIDEFVEN